MRHLIVLSCLAIQLASPIAGQDCVSPNGKEGSCIAIRSCPDLYSMLSVKPLRPETTNFLRSSQCGSEGKDPMVCCPGVVLYKLPEECGIDDSDRIFGGEKTELDEYPWMTLLGYTQVANNKKGFYCGGTLIDGKYVLTAAHCVKSKIIPSQLRLDSVRLGEHNTLTDPDCNDSGCNDPVVDIPIDKIIVHEKYNADNVAQLNDIALLKLKKSVIYTQNIKPICMPINKEIRSKKMDTFLQLWAAGWGRTETGKESDEKLKVLVPSISMSACQSQYTQLSIVLGQGQICAGGRRGRDTCRGDSGGPLMAYDNDRWYLLGVVSFGPTPCGMEGWPGVYTKVADFITWIRINMD